jgi:hypothetical protein
LRNGHFIIANKNQLGAISYINYFVTVSNTCLPALETAVFSAGASLLRTIEFWGFTTWKMAEQMKIEKNSATKYMPTQNKKGW